MGWGRFLLLGNLGQQLDFADQEGEIRRLRNSMDSLRDAHRRTAAGQDEIAGLRREIDELRLYLAVLVRAIVAKGVLSEAELRALVEMVDAEDGAADGSFQGPVA